MLYFPIGCPPSAAFSAYRARVSVCCKYIRILEELYKAIRVGNTDSPQHYTNRRAASGHDPKKTTRLSQLFGASSSSPIAARWVSNTAEA